MKRSATVSVAAVVLLSAMSLSGCGSTNNFGASVDIVSICAFDQGETGGDCRSNPEFSMAFNAPLFADVAVINRMNDTSTPSANSGLTVRLSSLEVDYRTPNGRSIPVRREQLTQNVGPGQTETVQVTLMSVEQIDYVRTRRALFPEFPFQVNLHVTLRYDTTGAETGSVERLITVEFTE